MLRPQEPDAGVQRDAVLGLGFLQATHLAEDQDEISVAGESVRVLGAHHVQPGREHRSVPGYADHDFDGRSGTLFGLGQAPQLAQHDGEAALAGQGLGCSAPRWVLYS